MILGQLGSQVSNDGDLMRMIQDMQRQIRELAAANPFAPMGITPNANGFTVTGNEIVNGSLTVNGPASITGTLSLPAGIIGNDALTSPISAYVSHVDASNFALGPGANVEKVRATISVPSGYTQALVNVVSTISATNSTSSTDNIYLQISINGTSVGWSAEGSAPIGGVGFAGKGAAKLITGLSGSFYIAALTSTNVGNWAASTGNQNAVNIDASVLFLR